MMSPQKIGSFFGLLLCLGIANAVFAHESRPAIVDLVLVEGEAFILSLNIDLEELITGVDESTADDDPKMIRYRQLRALPAEDLALLAAEYDWAADIQLQLDQAPIAVEQPIFQIDEVGDVSLARESLMRFSGRLPSLNGLLTWQLKPPFGEHVFRITNAQGEEVYTYFLAANEPSEPIALAADTQQSALSVFINYINIGFTHILPKGLDHILFVVALFLLSSHLKPLFWQITGFTLAHSVTLVLATLGWIRLPAEIVEPLIALSILYVAIENTRTGDMKPWRPWLVFAFGLLHGLGFAGVLADIGLQPTYFIMALVGFNLGVELGQLSIIGLCFLLVGLGFRHKSWYRARITNPASLLIAAIATYWLLERTLLSG